MLVLGLQGSPRKKGNTSYLLDIFMDAVRTRGARTHVLHVDREDIKPCKELIVCEKKGTCPIKDAMQQEVYGLLRRAEIVVAASPIFFYNVTAQLKALIDRSQTLWARKYRLKLKDPLTATRCGVVLAVAATQGKQLFDGLQLTAQYFFDAIDARPAASLTYRGIEHAGDMAAHPDVMQDVDAMAEKLLAPLQQRKRILFTSRSDDSSGPMAAGFAQYVAGRQIEAQSAGSQPGRELDPAAIQAMAEKSIDLAFLRPQDLAQVEQSWNPDLVVTLDSQELHTGTGAEQIHWELPSLTDSNPSSMAALRDEIETRVQRLINNL